MKKLRPHVWVSTDRNYLSTYVAMWVYDCRRCGAVKSVSTLNGISYRGPDDDRFATVRRIPPCSGIPHVRRAARKDGEEPRP